MSVHFPGLGFSLDYVGKSVRIAGFEITIYGILIAVGMVVGLAVVAGEAKRHNENQDLYLMMALVAVITGTIGGRVFYVAFSWPLYQNHVMEIFHISGGGMSVYGVLGGGALGIALFCRIQKLPFARMADTASMGFAAGQIIGRWGDFFNRESFGEYTNTVLAMELPLSAVRSSEVTARMREHLVDVNGVSCIRVHPLFLYESLWCLLVFLCLLVWKRRSSFQGEICMRYLAGYGFGRFFIEGLRTDALLIPGTRMAVGQAVSAALVVIFGLGAFISRSMVKKREDLRRRRQEALREAEEQEERERVPEKPELEETKETPADIQAEKEKKGYTVPEEESHRSFFTEQKLSGDLPKAPVLRNLYFAPGSGEEEFQPEGAGEEPQAELPPESGGESEAEPQTGLRAAPSSSKSE